MCGAAAASRPPPRHRRGLRVTTQTTLDAATPSPRESPSNHRRAVAATTSVRESAVPHVLTPRAHAAYDGWIQELCADAEEAAAERDRLKAKLAKLKEEHKRKMMIKILSRMSNMTYYQAWSAWYNGTIKINQLSADEELKMLLREVAAAKEQAEKLEAEAQARADEAAAQAMGAATDKQRNLCKKIFTRMIQGKTRVFWQHWDMQTFGKKRMQAVMKKVLKRLLKGQLHKGYQQWKYVATKWDLVQKIALKDRLIKELEDLERKAKAFEKECESRQEAAMQAALNRATGEQKELLIKILAKMTGNMSVFAFKIWAEKVRKFNESTTLTTKILYRMINMKKSLGFKKWFEVCMGDAQDKFKLKEELLMGQRDQLLAVLRARAEQLEKLQAEAAELLEASQRNAADTCDADLDALRGQRHGHPRQEGARRGARHRHRDASAPVRGPGHPAMASPPLCVSWLGFGGRQWRVVTKQIPCRAIPNRRIQEPEALQLQILEVAGPEPGLADDVSRPAIEVAAVGALDLHGRRPDLLLGETRIRLREDVLPEDELAAGSQHALDLRDRPRRVDDAAERQRADDGVARL